MSNKAWEVGSGEWSTGADWMGGTSPTNTDDAMLSNGGILNVGSSDGSTTDFSAVAQTLTVSKGTMTIYGSGALMLDGLSVTGGSLTVDGGGLTTGASGQGGTVFTQSGNVTVTNFGNLTVGQYITGAVSGTVTLLNGGSYDYQDSQASSSSGNIVNFAGNAGGTFQDQAAWSGTIQNFNSSNSNSLSFNGQISSFGYNAATTTLTVHTSSGTYTEKFTDNAHALKASDFSDAGDPFAIKYAGALPCYATGTRIRTVRGHAIVDVAIEDLAVGDLAVTASGQARPIRWLGHRTVDCREQAQACEAVPVRIAAHAFGVGKPCRDLVVSPAHAICVDVLGEMLVPAFAFLNGATVTRDRVEQVTYWHVELEGEHDILLAENLPAESYLDCGNRAFLAGGADAAARLDPDLLAKGSCRERTNDSTLLTALRARLRDHALALGWWLENAPLGGMRLIADGATILPDTDGLAARFLLPAEARDVWLVSTASVPWDVGDVADGRRLGLCLAALGIDDGLGTPHVLALDDPRLTDGFHPVEATCRWTDGRARLSPALWAGCRGHAFLRLELARPCIPAWRAPIVAEAALRAA